jgi:hypothetical protein
LHRFQIAKQEKLQDPQGACQHAEEKATLLEKWAEEERKHAEKIMKKNEEE